MLANVGMGGNGDDDDDDDDDSSVAYTGRGPMQGNCISWGWSSDPFSTDRERGSRVCYGFRLKLFLSGDCT